MLIFQRVFLFLGCIISLTKDFQFCIFGSHAFFYKLNQINMKKLIKVGTTATGPSKESETQHLNLPLRFLQFLLIALMAIAVTTSCKKDKEKKKAADLHEDIGNVVEALTNFVEAAVLFESAQFQNMTIPVMEKTVNDYLTTGAALVEKIDKVNSGNNKLNTKSTQNDACITAVTGFFDISGLSTSLMKDLGKLIEETGDTLQALRSAHQQQLITDEQYKTLVDRVRLNKPLDAVGIGFSAIMGAGASGLTGSAITASAGLAAAVSLPGLVAVAVVGGTTSYLTYKLWTWYKGPSKDGTGFYMSAVNGKLGDVIPASLFANGASVAIAIDGFRPILIENFKYPQVGNKITLEIDAGGLTPLKNSQNTEGQEGTQSGVLVCYLEEPAIGTDCGLIAYVTGYPVPTQPASGQSVTVVGSVLPTTPDCMIQFSIVGTDGYSNSSSRITNASGQASFYIPGAQPGVIDRVTITAANGVTYVVTYVFSGGGKTNSGAPLPNVAPRTTTALPWQ